MGLFWLDSDDVGRSGAADAFFRNGYVWLDMDDADADRTGAADAFYRNGCVWLDMDDFDAERTGSADAFYRNRYVWLDMDDADRERTGAADAFYHDGCVWLDMDDADADRTGAADAHYVGGGGGVAAATLLLLLSGRTDDDRPSCTSSPYVPPVVVEDPAVIAERRFAAASTLAEVYALRDELSSAGAVPALTITTLYRQYGEQLEIRRIDALLAKMGEQAIHELEAAYRRDFKKLSMDDLTAKRYFDLESYQLWSLAQLRETVNNWHHYELHALAHWHDEHPAIGILASRRLKEITERRIEEEAVAALTRLEPIEHATYGDLTTFFLLHRSANAANRVVPRVNDKAALASAYQNCRRYPIGEAIKKRYLELLDAEHARRGFWERLLYSWLKSHERNL